jgi:hypothetical protein
MHPDDLKYPAIFYEGISYLLERSDAHGASFFGGPFLGLSKGLTHGPRRLHHIATIHGDCFDPLRYLVGGPFLRLLYGICFECCELTYVNSANDVHIAEMHPRESAADWPYPEYPTYLPYFPLRLSRQIKCSLEKFSGLSCQPLEAEESEAIVLVPPSPVLGMSLWGPDGDSECAQIVFRCNLKTQAIRAYGQCG